MLQLTDQNYYSLEANQEYMSVSQYKDFRACESMAMAKIFGGWEDQKNEAFLVGNYVHSWSDGTLEKFRAENPDIFASTGKSKGELKAPFKVAEEMIKALVSDDFIKFVLQGDKEVIFTAHFAGTMWKCKMDVYHPERRRFVDLKTVKNLTDRVWSNEHKYYQNFIEGYGYLIQMSVYAEIEKRYANREEWLEPIMVAVTKEDPPDKAIIHFDQETIQSSIDQVEFYMPHILEVKSGQVKPNRCEKCRYCRETKKLTKVLHWSEL